MKEGQDGRFGTLRQRRRRRAQALYEFEMALHEEGGIPDFIYDERQDLFRFPEDGTLGMGGVAIPCLSPYERRPHQSARRLNCVLDLLAAPNK